MFLNDKEHSLVLGMHTWNEWFENPYSVFSTNCYLDTTAVDALPPIIININDDIDDIYTLESWIYVVVIVFMAVMGYFCVGQSVIAWAGRVTATVTAEDNKSSYLKSSSLSLAAMPKIVFSNSEYEDSSSLLLYSH